MAPKKHGKSKQQQKKQELDRPKITDAELAAAKQVLEDKDAKRRANSNMMYWLKSQNMRESYDEASPEVRKQFALEWFAKSLADGTVDKSSKHKAGTQKTAKESAKWWSKHKIIEVFGTEKGEARIACYERDPKRHRPDRDTGLDSEWHREYRIQEDEEEDMNYDGTEHELKATKDQGCLRDALDKHRLF